MPKSQSKKHYEWVILPQEYFSLALVGLKFLKKLLPNEPFKSGLKDKFNFSHPVSYLITPIIYNFKHGIELYLKGIGNIWDQDYEHSHDLIFLLNTLINKLNKESELSFVSNVLETKLRPVIDKYYFGLYIPSNNSKNMPDLRNESERYTESKGYSIQKIWHRSLGANRFFIVDIKLVKSIEKDIRVVHNILRQEVYSKVCNLKN